jgi:2-oxoisovalerate dehydrogenase E1 component
MEISRNLFLENLFLGLLKPRLIEEKMLLLLRQGKISKWFSGIGQEAISVGVTLALQNDDYILPVHRNLGVFTSRNVPLDKLFFQFKGSINGFTKGRDRSFHFSIPQYYIHGMISHLGAQLSVADGIALAEKLMHTGKICCVFCGEGATSEGEFHEALNVAAVWNLPVLFVIENNGYALSTPTSEQFAFESFLKKGEAYGIEAYGVDGNDVEAVYSSVKDIVQRIRNDSRPRLLEAITFRMRGHEEASGTKYIPDELFEKWAEKDPIILLEKKMEQEGYWSHEWFLSESEKIKNEIEEAWKIVEEAENNEQNNSKYNPQNELNEVYAPHVYKSYKPQIQGKEKRFVDAVRQALIESMKIHQNLILMGQDIAEYGGVFKVTEGLVELFGKERVRNTPLCESAILGVALGLSIKGMKAMVEMQYADFVTCGFNQIVNNLAKIYYRTGIAADVVIRMPTGAGLGAGPFHSQSTEAWFFHVPGLKIVYPSNPFDAKGLLNESFNDPNPILFFEHKVMYRSIYNQVPDNYYTLPIGQASVVHKGEKLTIITYGMGVHWSLELVKELKESIEVVDLKTLLPWDKETVFNSVKKTGKVIVIHEANQTGGVGAEIAASIAEECFTNLDAPVMRIGALDTPIPFNKTLEEHYLPKARIKEKVKLLLLF